MKKHYLVPEFFVIDFSANDFLESSTIGKDDDDFGGNVEGGIPDKDPGGIF